jgi:hypothetical protein
VFREEEPEGDDVVGMKSDAAKQRTTGAVG